MSQMMHLKFPLQLIHPTVVDSSVVFPHKMGPPKKRALRNLAGEYLKKIIQNDGKFLGPITAFGGNLLLLLKTVVWFSSWWA